MLVVSLAAADDISWLPQKGTIVLAGGGLAPDTAGLLVDRILRLAGGAEASIVVIPSASVDAPALPKNGPLPPTVESTKRVFEAHGAKRVTFLHTRDRDTANSPEFAAVLRSASAVFLTGGAFRVLDDLYHGTLTEREVKGVLERGGVLAGDSAGAIALGCFWVGWDAPSATATKLTDGLCALPNVTVTPHLQKMGGDGRAGDILNYAARHPGIMGIDIQENTFVVLHGSVAEVVGAGNVQLIDATKNNAEPYLRISGGQRHDFAK
jgi:cyanophycinase